MASSGYYLHIYKTVNQPTLYVPTLTVCSALSPVRCREAEDLSPALLEQKLQLRSPDSNTQNNPRRQKHFTDEMQRHKEGR